MKRRPFRLTGVGSRITRAGDVLIPAALAAISLTEIWVDRVVEPGFPGPRGVQTLGALLMTVALGWRRRYPVATLACVTIGLGVEWPWDRASGQVSFEAFLAIVIAYYSVGAHVEPRRGLPVVAIGMLPLLAADIANVIAGYRSTSDGGLYVLLLVCWAVGNAFRRRGARELALERRAQRLERERAQNVRAAAAEERARIARELHDVVAHSVSVMVVQMGAAREIMESEPHTARDALRSAEATGRQALDEMRRMLGILRTSDERGALAPQPRLAHLDDLVEQARDAGLPVALTIDGTRRPLPPGIELAAYRIVQEALTNVRKHAGALRQRRHRQDACCARVLQAPAPRPRPSRRVRLRNRTHPTRRARPAREPINDQAQPHQPDLAGRAPLRLCPAAPLRPTTADPRPHRPVREHRERPRRYAARARTRVVRRGQPRSF